MLKICDENKESIKFRFLGSNEIGARELSKFLEATVSTFEKIVSNSEEETYIKLNISSVEKGSFLIVLTSIVTKIPKFFETVKNSKEVIATFKECLEIKEKLKQTFTGERLDLIKHWELIAFSDEIFSVYEIIDSINEDDIKAYVEDYLII